MSDKKHKDKKKRDDEWRQHIDLLLPTVLKQEMWKLKEEAARKGGYYYSRPPGDPYDFRQPPR